CLARRALGSNTKSCDIHDDHNEREKVQAHQQSNGGVHRQNTTKPNTARFFYPNENRVTDLEQTDRNSEHRQSVFESDENIGRNHRKRWPDQRAPKIRAVPPTVAKTFCQAADKVNIAEMHLEHSSPKTQRQWVFRCRFCYPVIKGITVGQRR